MKAVLVARYRCETRHHGNAHARGKKTAYTLSGSTTTASRGLQAEVSTPTRGRALGDLGTYETIIMHNPYSCFPAKLPASARAFARRFSRPSDATPTASAAAAQPREAVQPSLSFFLAT